MSLKSIKRYITSVMNIFQYRLYPLIKFGFLGKSAPHYKIKS